MYINPPNSELLFQGDILEDIPFFNLILTKFPLRKLRRFEGEISGFEERLFVFETIKDLSDNDVVAVSIAKSRAIIISQSCDANNKEFISVAKIYPIEEKVKEFDSTSDKKKGKILKGIVDKIAQPNIFYLRDDRKLDFPRMVADFTEIVTFINEDVRDYFLARRKVSLSPNAIEDLQFRLGHFFGRYARNENYWTSEDDKRLLSLMKK